MRKAVKAAEKVDVQKGETKKSTIQEKLELARQKHKIQEKLKALKEEKVKAAESISKVDEKAELKAKIQEKLETAKKKKAIQERVKALRNK